jgi:hypothetical protein
MLDDKAAEALTRSFTLGITRQKLPLAAAFAELPDNEPLAALALLGQRRRFRRPPAKALAPAAPLFSDSRPTVPEAARRPLVTLFTGKDGDPDDAIAEAVADAIAAAGLKLHPFDLPILDRFVAAEAERLGGSAVAWTERKAPEATEGRGHSLFVETVDETNWTAARPAQKARFIREIRARDPDRARALVESVFAGELAPSRLGLVNALRERLSAADSPFLENIAKDRAATVREAAAALLARVPNSAKSAARLHDSLSRIERSKTGLLRQRVTLRLTFPATAVNAKQREIWARDTFAGLDLEDLAGGLGLGVGDMVDAASGDSILMTVLAMLASTGRCYDILRRLVDLGALDAWEQIVAMEEFAPADPPAWVEAALRPAAWTALTSAPLSFALLYKRIRMPLPASTAEAILKSAAWQRYAASFGENNMVRGAEAVQSGLATLTPASTRPRLRQALASLPPSSTARATTAMTLLDLIESTSNRETAA